MERESKPVESAKEPDDDWADGSWTVHCPCGVTFDDGKMMVSCDECQVWVHTRCARFVRYEEPFTCDKCKRKNGAWTDSDSRGHVHGVPALFHGSSSVFTPQLWKSTGHIPKKFNFQYREFPCWDEMTNTEPIPAFGELISSDPQRKEAKNEEDENRVDIGADLLFSSSKEVKLKLDKNAAPALEDDLDEDDDEPDDDYDDVYDDDDNDDSDDDEPPPSRHVKNVRFSLQSLHVSKRKSEEASKDQVVKKKG